MSTTFTKEEKKYFDFLLDMGFYYDTDLSDKNNIEYIRYLDGDRQFVSLNKDGFIGVCMGEQIYDVCLCLDISTSAIGPTEDCGIPQQFNHYYAEDDKYTIFEKYKKIIVDTLASFEKNDHITGSMNEYVYNNYISIAKQTNFIPKTMDELNQYAIKLRDQKKIHFDDFIYIISSLMIRFLIDNTNINKIYYCGLNKDLKKLGIFLNPYPEKPILGFRPTANVKRLFDNKNNDLFYINRQYLDNYFEHKRKQG